MSTSSNASDIQNERKLLREKNLNCSSSRLTSSDLKKLDSNLKKNTSFTKKLKNITEEQKEALCNELVQLNLTKYISEIVIGIAESKLKITDVNAAVKICSLLHQRYAEFTPALIPQLVSQFPSSGKSVLQIKNETEQERTAKLTKRRVTLRFLGELFLVGIIESHEMIFRILQDMIQSDQNQTIKEIAPFQNLPLIVSFMKTVGKEMLNLKGKRNSVDEGEEPGEENQKPLEEKSKETEDSNQTSNEEEIKYLTQDQKKNYLDLLENYFDLASNYLVQEHKNLVAKEKENQSILESKGELPEAHSSAYDKLRKAYDRFVSNLNSLAELLKKDPPEFPQDSNTTRVDSTANSVNKEISSGNESIPLWDDEDTRTFYEVLPDLKSQLPGILFGDQNDSSKEKEDDINETANTKEVASTPSPSPSPSTVTAPNQKSTDSSGNTITIDQILQKLPSCVNRDLCYQLCVDFCYINTKVNRKKLAKALFNVPRTQLALIPYYSRITATLAQVMKDFAPMLVSQLEEEFTFLFKEKNQLNIESKIRNIRFLAELTKFRLCSTSTILQCLSMCLDDFAHHNIDVACNLLETCGRFLYRTPETHIRTKNLLEKMMRLKHTNNLQTRLETMVDNAYYYCVPSESKKKVKKELNPIQKYVTHLIYTVLEKSTAKFVLKQLRKIPWEQEGEFVFQTLLRIHKGKFSNISLVAAIVSGLAVYHELLTIKFVDSVLEEIRYRLEFPDSGKQQRQVMYIKLLGELYNYCVIESQLIFDTLYTLIIWPGFGKPLQSIPIDPSSECFRVLLVCTLLDTCGQYFDKGSSKKKLDRFLIYFQRYFMSKHIPMDIEFNISDTLDNLRPKFVRAQTFEQACEEVIKQEQEELQQLKTPNSSNSSNTSKTDEEEEEERTKNENDDENEDEEKEESDEEIENSSKTTDNDDEQVIVKTKIQKETDEEEKLREEFDKELKKMVQESLDSRKSDSKIPVRDLPVPLTLVRGSNASSSSSSLLGPRTDSPNPFVDGAVQFKVLLKKGNKAATKDLMIPLESTLAVSNLNQKEEDRKEQEELKKKVLQYDEEEVFEENENQQKKKKSSQKKVLFHSGGSHRKGTN